MIFKKQKWISLDIYQRAQTEAIEWDTAITATPSRSELQTNRSHISSWSPPLYGLLKCNHDACFHMVSSQTGAGWIVRNSNGEFITAASSFLPKANTALEAKV